MKKIAVLLLSVLTFMTLKAADPDFAYPKTTLENAVKNYDAALKAPTRSGIAMIKSLLEITGATAAIDRDSLVRVVPRIDRAIAAFPDGSDKALMFTIKAEVLNAIYSGNPWTYDRVQTPLEPLPADITEWNGQQFNDQINGALSTAFSMVDNDVSLRLYVDGNVIKADRLALSYFPTVKAFIALKATAIHTYLHFDNIEDIYRQMIAASEPQSSAWFYWNGSLGEAGYISSEELEKLFLDNKDCEDAGYILNIIATATPNYDSAPKWLLPELRAFISRFPDYWQTPNLQNALLRLTNSSTKISLDRIVAPGSPFEVAATQYFTKSFGVKIFSISADDFSKSRFNPAGKSPVKTAVIKNTDNSEKTDTTISLTLDRPGYYVAVPVVNDSISKVSRTYFICSSFYPSLMYTDKQGVFAIADFVTGAPVQNVAVAEIGNTPRQIGKSYKNGFVEFTLTQATKNNRWRNSSYSFTDSRTTLKFPEINSYTSYNRDEETTVINAEIFLDRQVYHPGDTVHWAAVITEGEKVGEAKTVSNLRMTVSFKDVNLEQVDSMTVTTDAVGRIHGSFVAPTTGLTGNYRIMVATTKDDGKVDNWLSTKSVTVSDFKLPTFKVDSLTVERDRPSAGSVTLGGLARTYSGMPVSGAKVEVEIWQANRWRWFTRNKQIGNIDALTDASGHFNIVVPNSILSKGDTKCFIAAITVTNSAGEARSVSKSFTTGKPYTIEAYYNIVKFNTDKPVTDLFEAFDADGKAVDIEVRWWLNNNSEEKPVASGICRTVGQTLDLSGVRSGEYKLSYEPVDTTLADGANDVSTLQLYSINKNTMPDSSPIFLPVNKCLANDNGHGEFIVGIPFDDTYIYKVTCDDHSATAFENEKFGKGFHTIKIALDKNTDRAEIWLMTVRNGKFTRQSVSVARPDKRGLNLVGSAMRDRLSSGATERWTLRLTDSDKNPVTGGLIATMFNAALNDIERYRMASEFDTYIPMPNMSISFANNYSVQAVLSCQIKRLKINTLTDPTFDPAIDLRNLYSYRNIVVRGTVAGNGVDKVEELALDEVVTVGYASNKKAAMVGSVAVTEAAADVNEVEEDVEEEDGSKEAPESNDDFQYRSGEVLQAFWMPELTFNDKGEAEICFTVPDANTTWSFNAFAWTKDLRAATMIRQFVSAKPVMVQPNLPRFLRVGDRARLLATVFNNSDSIAAVTSVIEIFDIASGKVISTATSVDTIAASASAIVAIDVEAPDDAAAIGYRVRSTLGRFTDGEQNFIPVIASTSAVIESEPFYLNPGEAEFSTTLPRDKDMQATLEYTANPAWNIIKELPGLSTTKAFTSTAAARQLFASATAAGLLRSYPALAEVLKAWSENPDSEALTSRLAKNEELKAALLNATPWVQAAASDTERMARLTLLFDRKAVDAAIRSSIDALKKFHKADGGWSWGSWGEKSSAWATNMILQDLGRLNSIGYLPADKELKNMIAAAISYYESQIPAKAKTDGSFTFIATLFPDAKIGLRGKQIIGATVQSYITGWKSSPTWEKSIEALILAANGHPAVAKTVMASLSEFAVPSHDHGTSFPSVTNVNDYADLLYAFAKLSPDSKLIDGMRQWLVLRQQTTEQLGSIDPTRLIAAFTATGSAWLADSSVDTDISVGGRQLTIENAELATGNFVTALPSDAAGAELAIVRRRADVPAYGAVMSRFNATSKDIKASSCSDLSIEKRITALRDGRWQYVDNVRLGEQVRILLTIKTKRDLQYVTVIDERPAAFEPVDQLPGWVWNGGAGFYRENRNADTNLFIDYLPKGTYQITVDMTASVAGSFTSGIATVQSQLAPEITAHSAGSEINCN